MRLCKRRIYRGLFSQIEVSFYRSLFTYRGLFLYTWKDAFIRDVTHSYMTNLIICDMTHLYATWLIHMWHASFIRDMTHSYVTWLIHTWHASFIRDMTHSYVTWLVYMWHGFCGRRCKFVAVPNQRCAICAHEQGACSYCWWHGFRLVFPFPDLLASSFVFRPIME